MEKYIYIIESISTLNEKNEKKDNVFAVTSEEEAIKNVEKYNEKAKNETKIDGFKCWYIYEKIRLFD